MNLRKQLLTVLNRERLVRITFTNNETVEGHLISFDRRHFEFKDATGHIGKYPKERISTITEV